MIKHTTKLTSRSIEQGGMPSDYRKALAEYLWNGFDAGASKLSIDFSGNALGYLSYLTITDNGSGIDIETIDSTFGNFLDSMKVDSYQSDSFIKGKKGKGRYAFSIFANTCVWSTTFKSSEGALLDYSITINKCDQQNFGTDDKRISANTSTGTKVQFFDFFDLSSDLLLKDEFAEYLAAEFGWFLYLNRDKEYAIYINGEKLDYSSIISNQESFPHIIGDYTFTVSYIRWTRLIGDKFYFYFLNSNKKENFRKHTSFNNNTVEFFHSVYIESTYFDSFKETQTDAPVMAFAEKNQSDMVFKHLLKFLNTYVAHKEKAFIKDTQATRLISNYHTLGIFPKFRNNQYDILRKEDLELVVKELYCAEPKIFQGLKKEQSKTLVGFLNLLLDSEQRECILEILEGVVKLSDEEREELADTLKKTKLVHIAAMVNMLANRYKTVELLRLLVYDLEKFSNERDHIQKVVEHNYWLFGEQYNLISADKAFEVVLENYLNFFETNPGKKPVKINHKQRLRRPDVFICRQAYIPDDSSAEHDLEENVIVELKRPSVVIGNDQFRQIEDYLRFIIDEPRFNSRTRRWKFLLVGKSVDKFIEDKYESQKHKNKRFLVESYRNFEIYALTWDDLFRQFEARHKHFIDKLEFRESILEELNSQGIGFSREAADTLTRMSIVK